MSRPSHALPGDRDANDVVMPRLDPARRPPSPAAWIRRGVTRLVARAETVPRTRATTRRARWDLAARITGVSTAGQSPRPPSRPAVWPTSSYRCPSRPIPPPGGLDCRPVVGLRRPGAGRQAVSAVRGVGFCRVRRGVLGRPQLARKRTTHPSKRLDQESPQPVAPHSVLLLAPPSPCSRHTLRDRTAVAQRSLDHGSVAATSIRLGPSSRGGDSNCGPCWQVSYAYRFTLGWPPAP